MEVPIILLEVKGLKKQYKEQEVLKNVSFHLNNNEHIGLIGNNGAGKSTILNLLTGEDKQDHGSINWIKKNQRIFYLKQENMWDLTRSLGSQIPNLSAFWLSKCGIDKNTLEKKAGKLSGGEKTRASLANAFGENPDLLILDEPTNHLDIKGVIWLEKVLNEYKGAVLIVSHERSFLDQTVTRILELDKGIVTSYKGNYSSYALQIREKEEKIKNEYYNYLKEKRRIEEAITKRKEMAQKSQKKANKVTRDDHRNAKGYYGGSAKRLMKTAKSMEKRLELLYAEKPTKQQEVSIEFNEPKKTGPDLIVAEDVSFFYNHKKCLFKEARFSIKRGDKVAIIGENGSGKTTLLKLIIGELTPSQGHIHKPHRKPGYLAQEMDNLNPNSVVLKELLKNSDNNKLDSLIRPVLSDLLFEEEDLLKKIRELSGGEKVRLSIAKLLLSSSDWLVLDEPTNQLDLKSKEKIEESLKKYPGTIIFVSHDRYLLKKIANKILSITEKSIEVYHGGYEAFINRLESPSREKQENRLLLENKLSKLSAALATTSSKDELKKLDEEFLNVSRALNDLK